MQPKTLFLAIMLASVCLSVAAQSRFPQTVCGLDEDISPFELERNNAAVAGDSRLVTYLNDIKQVFNQQYAQYNIRTISNKNIAAAHLQRIGQNAAARVITINETYYAGKAGSATNQEALLIWVLAHEVQHHTNGDLHYHNHQTAANLKKEILADERAGYAVGKLTNVPINFFSEVLPRVLYPSANSKTHPPREYRIMAAKAGWMRAKLENTSEVTIGGVTYKKVTQSDGDRLWYSTEASNAIWFDHYKGEDLYLGEGNNEGKSGKGFYIYYDGPNTTFSSIYYGEWSNDYRNGNGTFIWLNGDKYAGQYKNNKRHGQGTFTWASGNKYVGSFINGKRSGQGTIYWTSGNRYVGNFADGKMSGKGTKYYTNGQVYRGEWEDDARHGDGILYKGEEVLKAGCWENGKYIGVTCE